MVQTQGPVRLTFPRIQGEKKQACQTQRELAQPGNGQRDHSDKQAERGADADRNIAEIGGPLYRVAEEGANSLDPGTVHQHADTVADFEDQVRVGQQVAVAAPDLDDGARHVCREIEVADGAPDDGAFRHENPDIVQILAVVGDAPGLEFSKQGDGLLQRCLVGGRCEQHIILVQHEARRRAGDCDPSCAPQRWRHRPAVWRRVPENAHQKRPDYAARSPQSRSAAPQVVRSSA